MRRILPVLHGLALLSLAIVPAAAAATPVQTQPAGHELPDGSAWVRPQFIPSGQALEMAPECDRAVTVQVHGVWYAVGLLHNHWRVAVANYRVRSPEGEYHLRVTFNAQGVLVDVVARPHEALPAGFSEACVGLEAKDLHPAEAPPHEPRQVLCLAVQAFTRALGDRSLEGAVLREADQLDAWTGATP